MYDGSIESLEFGLEIENFSRHLVVYHSFIFKAFLINS